MLRTITFLIFIVLQGANAQDCVPEPVTNITLDLNYTLYWEPSTNCDDTHYLIYIRLDEDNLEYIYNSDNPYLIVEFLPSCERFLFDVRASSHNELSESSQLTTYIPAPPGANLTITTFEASTQLNGTTFLRWIVDERYAHCAREFRVIIVPQFRGPRDVYTANNFLFLDDLIPCGVYQFLVTALYNIQTQGPIALIRRYEAPGRNSSLPVLQHISAADTYINVSWSFPEFDENRCPITTLELEGLPYYHGLYPVFDGPQRPLFNTTISPLEPESMYIFRTYIINSEGPSKAYPIGIQTRPQLNP